MIRILVNSVGDWINHRKNEDLGHLRGMRLLKSKRKGTQNVKGNQVEPKTIFN